MTKSEIELPYYVKLTIKLLMILLIGIIIYLGRSIIVPIAFSVLLSIILLPLTQFLERHRFPRSLANLLSVTLALILIVSVLYFLSSQLSRFLLDFPSIKKHVSEHYITLQNWVQQKLHIDSDKQDAMVNDAGAKVKDSITGVAGQLFLGITQSVASIILVVVYTFFILYYRHVIKAFLFDVFERTPSIKVKEVLTESKYMVQNYIIGLLIEMSIVASANSILLLALGVRFAIFFGVFTAILNLLPYIGIFISIICIILVTLATSDNLHSILFMIIGMECIHFIDANFILPKIVGSKVKVNALVTIAGLLIGASLVGVAGIILALPTVAILKIIFDRVDGLKPWGFLFGDIQREKKINFKKPRIPK